MARATAINDSKQVLKVTEVEREVARQILLGRICWLTGSHPVAERDPRWGTIDDEGYAPLVAWIAEPLTAERKKQSSFDVLAYADATLGKQRFENVWLRVADIVKADQYEKARTVLRGLLPYIDFSALD